MDKRTLQTLFLVSTLVIFAFGIIPAFYSVFSPTLEVRERPNSGITGIVTIGPVCPVVQKGSEDACADQPYRAELILTSVKGKFMERFSSNDDGSFTLYVLPGEYVIQNASDGPLPSLSPVSVRVVEGGFATATLQFDSGIR